MFTPSPEIVAVLSAFAPGFTAPTFRNALVLIYGTILAPGRRTVTAALRVMGLDKGEAFSKYHRVLNRARWSPLAMSRCLLALLIRTFAPAGVGLRLLIDETLERRQGPKIAYKGWFRDAVRSVGSHVALSLGIRWCVVSLLVAVPWSEREWALPFLVVPVLSEKTCHRLKKRHMSGVEWAIWIVKTLREWQPDRKITLVGDGGYAAVELVRACQTQQVRLITRLRWDATLYEAPEPQPKSKRGPKPKKGARQPSFAQRVADPKCTWKTATISWYGGSEKTVELLSGTGLWHTPGADPVALRWVIVRYEEEDRSTGKRTQKTWTLLCSETEGVTAEEIVRAYVGRWNQEVMFEEVRAYLGFETQRHWSIRAIERTTPCLFGLFSLVVLMAHALHPKELPLQQSAWYVKEEASFSDALAAVRSHLWNCRWNTLKNRMKYLNSPKTEEVCLIPRQVWDQLQQVLCHAA
jgi:hypothetical protein